MKNLYSVRPVTREDCRYLVEEVHYAGRFPSVSYAFGLFLLDDDELVGVVTYGTPPSSPLRRGIAGPEYADNVLELNRLVLRDNVKNEASILVSRSLDMLPPKKIVVSFADTSQKHIGTVYQACNFIYCGLSAKRTNWKVRGREDKHGYTVADEFRKYGNRSALMKLTYGDDFYREERPRKHRYIYIKGPKLWGRGVRKCLRYKVEPYPKRSN